MPALLLPHRRMPAGGSLNPEKLAVAVKSCGIEVDTPKVLGQDLAEAIWCVPACACLCRCMPLLRLAPAPLPGIDAGLPSLTSTDESVHWHACMHTPTCPAGP